MPPRGSIACILLRCLAAAIAFFAVGNHPYNYYVLTRWVLFLTCCWGAWNCRNRIWRSFAPAYIVIGLIFNPILPFHFHRSTWQMLDIAAGTVLVLSLVFPPAPKDSP
ncbi:MAG: hypothetical protein EXS31_09625 [Pedosphaera sp.]|nr:hypothetical protein [Pedosphaera sp.]